jgi:hypothetical protein
LTSGFGLGVFEEGAAILREQRMVERSGEQQNPLHHTKKMREKLAEIIDHLRADIEKVDEPRCRAMFETAAEVLGGLNKAFMDYEQKNEAAWR